MVEVTHPMLKLDEEEARRRGWSDAEIEEFIAMLRRFAENYEKVRRSRLDTKTGDACRECGSLDLSPAGRCFRCNNCGASTGCS